METMSPKSEPIKAQKKSENNGLKVTSITLAILIKNIYISFSTKKGARTRTHTHARVRVPKHEKRN